MINLVFYLGIGTLFTHELDAMLNHEWRVIPIIRALPDDRGLLVFVAAHVPMFAVLVALISSRNPKTRITTRIGLGVFLIFHGLLHILFKEHPAYEFTNILSNLLIFGGSTLGIIYLALEWNKKRRNAT